MNYGYVYDPDQDGDRYLKRALVLIGRRPNTTLVGMTTARTLQSFVRYLQDSSNVVRPITENIVVAAHANRYGWDIDLFGAGRNADFEMLGASMADPARSIAIPDQVVGANPGSPPSLDRDFHIKACNLGRWPKYLRRLQMALGGRVRVTAPKHFHGITSDDDGSDCFEWMGYEFVVFGKTMLATRAQLIDAFRAGQFKLIDGREVPAAAWTKWLRPFGRTIKETAKFEIRSKLGTSTGRRRSIKTEVKLIVSEPPSAVFVQDVEYDSFDQIPVGEDLQVAALRAKLAADISFRSPFPKYERLGYGSLDDMMDGLKWDVRTVGPSPSSGGKWILQFLGGRYQYELMVPIVDPSTDQDPTRGTLIYNHWPQSGVGGHRGILETNEAFFETAP